MTTIRRQLKIVTIAPVVTASSAYVAGNTVGTIFEMKHVGQESGAMAMLKSVLEVSAGKADPALMLVMFSKKPTGTYTDKTAFSVAAADLPNLTGIAKLAASPWNDFGSNSAADAVDLDVCVQSLIDSNNPGVVGSVWGVLYTTGTPTFPTTTDLTLKAAFEQY